MNGPCPFPRGDYYKISKKYIDEIFQREIMMKKETYSDKILKFVLQNHWTNFDQTWRDVSLCEANSSFYKQSRIQFSKRR